MEKFLLEVKNLKAKSEEKEILNGVDLRIGRGEVQALLGPNASGKSTFSKVISGNPKYKVTEGKIIFKGKDITHFSPEKRVKLGLSMVWQSPPAIKGIKLSQLLKKISKKPVNVQEGKELLEREVNLDFSGGEKKISELLQILALKPKLVIFDEIDSGLDIKKLGLVAKIIKKELVDKGVSILIITHSGQILNFLKPKFVNVMVDGKITCKANNFKKVLQTIKKYGYERCKKCDLFSN
ncbi:MAG: ABC transporter ATP-binding protein [Candidatus Pacebacteria bacterium]|nr:ABC transporter ATP-binding protein [Candidatus Paceibacterota bacterium]